MSKNVPWAENNLNSMHVNDLRHIMAKLFWSPSEMI
ncbi:hypothetical protein PITC_085940 [Penicillium italicum]|uniref:Uncharacterized protein n=1 Tax=Penicillium italicum TaxID=40296 RepID=A0A0A2L9K6_PENIT|nr:hypothetical protein PITC_085940 [Penicillium italicum]